MKVNIQDINVDAASIRGVGVNQLLVATSPDRNYNLFDDPGNAGNFVRYAYGDSLWQGSPAGILVSIGTVNQPGIDAFTIQYLTQTLYAFSGSIFSRARSSYGKWTNWVQLV